MGKENKAAWITGGCGIVATIIAALMGAQVGKNNVEQYNQSQISNINGNGNSVTMNSVDDLVQEYNALSAENEKLKKQNEQYFDDYTESTEENKALKVQLDDSPVVEFKNLGLCINGNDADINKNNSYAVINGEEYFSKDFIDNLVDKNTTTITVQDEVMYLGKVVADKEELLNQRIVDASNYEIVDSVIDSFGNIHTNAGVFSDYNGTVNYSLNKRFSLLRLKIAIDENSNGEDDQCIITVKADGKTVYTTKSLNKVSAHEIEEKDIKINNCSVLEISSIGDYGVYPIIYDAFVYN